MQENIDILGKTLYNNYDDIALGEIINIPTNEVLSMQSDRWRI